MQLTLLQPGGADYATLLLAHPDLKNQAASLIYLILCSTRGVFDVENYDFFIRIQSKQKLG